MHSHKDIETKSVFLINGTINHIFKVQNGFLCIQNSETKKTITKLPFPKMLCIFILGHTKITTSFIEHANKHGVPLVVMKPNFRTVYFYGTMAEANYLLRRRQHHWNKDDLSIAKQIVINKIENCKIILEKTKRKTQLISKFINSYDRSIQYIENCTTLSQLMAAEGRMASYYFSAYFEKFGWKQRLPRAKPDYINSALDIGYTMLFNYIEANARLFGFDLYVGVLHQLWFQRKSLVCDLQEPFRCIIDNSLYNALQKGLISENDFRLFKGSFYPKPETKSKFLKIYFDAIIAHKMSIYIYIQNYYRCFMRNSPIKDYPKFHLSND